MIKSVRIGLSAAALCLVASVPAIAQDASATVSKAQRTLTEMQTLIDGAAKRNAMASSASSSTPEVRTTGRRRTNTAGAPAPEAKKAVGAAKKKAPAAPAKKKKKP
ncbi:MAG: hypothetical protein ABJA67_04600 [Chthonomonadales bacterium]